jgi:hypothetical protein
MADPGLTLSFVFGIDSFILFFHRRGVVNSLKEQGGNDYILKDFERFITTFHNNVDEKSKPN